MKTEREITKRLIERISDMRKIVADFTKNEIKLDYRNIHELEEKLTILLASINELSWVLGEEEEEGGENQG